MTCTCLGYWVYWITIKKNSQDIKKSKGKKQRNISKQQNKKEQKKKNGALSLKRDTTRNLKGWGNSDFGKPLKNVAPMTTVNARHRRSKSASCCKDQSWSQLSLLNLVFKRGHQIVVLFQVQNCLHDIVVLESLLEAARVRIWGLLRALIHQQGPGFLLKGRIFAVTTHTVQLVFKF